MTEVPGSQSALGHDVFVSYASQDAAVANSIVENLEKHGCKCWIAPRDVKPGAQYADAIVRAINDAKAVMLVMSRSAVASSHVGKEIERASSKHKSIIAFRIDAAPLNHALEYFLSESQWIDVAKLGMTAALTKLAEAVGHVSALSPQAVPSPRSGRVTKRVASAAAVVIGVGAAVALGLHFWPQARIGVQAPTVAVISDKSIAVLPFTDMSEKKDQEYFADGMAEEIIDLLVKIPGLKVISRTSSFQFKGKTEDLRTIATQLGVAYVLQGSVRKSGERLRVTAQLINSQDGTHLWSQTYDRDLSDVLKMQDEIALALVRALQIEVGADMVSRPALVNTEAYRWYLQGRQAIDRNNQQGVEEALSDFQRALDLDPSFAGAAAGVGASYFVLGAFGFMPSAVAFQKARHALEEALKLDPKLAYAHAQLGDMYRAQDLNWPAADSEVAIARSLSPNDRLVLFISAAQSENMGRWDDALKYINAALARDPLSPSFHMILGYIQMGRGRIDEAEAAIRRTLEISPTFIPAHYILGIVLLARSQPEAALAEILKEKDEASRLGGSSMAFFALGRKTESDAALAQMVKSQADRHAFQIAQTYAYRGQSDEAFKWLDRAYVQKDPSLLILKSQAMFMKLGGDPRYKAFLKKMNLPDD
jgi:TolB-like protein/Flp pilus assembly protein TadD